MVVSPIELKLCLTAFDYLLTPEPAGDAAVLATGLVLFLTFLTCFLVVVVTAGLVAGAGWLAGAVAWAPNRNGV